MKDTARALSLLAALSDIDEDIILETLPLPVAEPRHRGESALSRFLSSGWVAAALSLVASVTLIVAIVLAGRLGESPWPQPPVVTDAPGTVESLPETLPPETLPETAPESETPPAPETEPEPDETLPETEPPEPSRGLLYKKNDDGTVTLMGRGSCRDSVLVIPEVNEAGRRVTHIGEEAFFGDDGITAVVIPDSVRTVGSGAFDACISLSEVTIGAGVGKIAVNAFWACPVKRVMITDIAAFCRIDFEIEDSNPLSGGAQLYLNGELVRDLVLPDTLRHIGDYAFTNYASLRSVKLPASLRSIGICAFSGCTELDEVLFPEGLTTVKESAFYGCTSLTSVVLPDSVTHLGDNVFSVCTSLISVRIGEGVTRVPAYGFYGCTSLGTLTLGSRVTVIDDSAFAHCARLTLPALPSSLTRVGNEAFHGCTSLHGITFPPSIREVGASAFRSCTSLSEISFPADAEVTPGDRAFASCGVVDTFTLPDRLTEIPSDFVNGTTIRRLYIGDLAAWCEAFFPSANANPIGHAEEVYMEGKLLRHLVIPSTVTAVSAYAFYGYTGISSVTLPDEIRSVGAYAFADCPILTDVTLGTGLQTVGSGAFIYITNPPRLHITDLSAFIAIDWKSSGNNPLSAGSELYLGEELIRDLRIPEGVTYIPKTAFRQCKTITSVTLPDSVTAMDAYAFADCPNLTSVTLGRGLTHIPDHAFADCAALDSVRIPEGTTHIGEEAFTRCRNLTELALPDTLRSLGHRAFAESGLTEVTVPTGVTEMDMAVFAACSQLRRAVIPADISVLPAETFTACPSLSEVILPAHLAEIGDRAFLECTALARLSLPGTLASIGKDAFAGCYRLSEVEFGGTRAAWEHIRTETSEEVGQPSFTVVCSDGSIPA